MSCIHKNKFYFSKHGIWINSPITKLQQKLIKARVGSVISQKQASSSLFDWWIMILGCAKRARDLATHLSNPPNDVPQTPTHPPPPLPVPTLKPSLPHSTSMKTLLVCHPSLFTQKHRQGPPRSICFTP